MKTISTSAAFQICIKPNTQLASDGPTSVLENCEMRSLKGPHAPCTLNDIKDRQSSKIRRLGETLIAAGFKTLDEQAKVLGLPRSTAWTVLKGAHKASGLSAATINRMLSSPTLPLATRVAIFDYIKEKTAGFYGHSGTQLQRFKDQITADVFFDHLLKDRDRPNHSCDDDQRPPSTRFR